MAADAELASPAGDMAPREVSSKSPTFWAVWFALRGDHTSRVLRSAVGVDTADGNGDSSVPSNTPSASAFSMSSAPAPGETGVAILVISIEAARASAGVPRLVAPAALFWRPIGVAGPVRFIGLFRSPTGVPRAARPGRRTGVADLTNSIGITRRSVDDSRPATPFCPPTGAGERGIGSRAAAPVHGGVGTRSFAVAAPVRTGWSAGSSAVAALVCTACPPSACSIRGNAPVSPRARTVASRPVSRYGTVLAVWISAAPRTFPDTTSAPAIWRICQRARPALMRALSRCCCCHA